MYGTHLFIPGSIVFHTEQERINAFRTGNSPPTPLREGGGEELINAFPTFFYR